MGKKRQDMIKITIDLIPALDPIKGQRTIAEAEIRNDATGTKTKGNYTYSLHTAKKMYYATGRITGFKRKGYNVWALLFHILWDAMSISKPTVVKNSKEKNNE